ncbi:manganese transport protein [Actinopolymorpha cephalotaxi]|uniref:Manganese transport protein n=1 Tax=Actinopolymorpha cephalotaxi TaxID=504797 RepID=A0ABX2S0Q2_9ACTN|nr:Nramp family divalent metal transporter [Actinopolymorpha cephalotaxi]NYH82007.1 manganese transport protein [Actinopolymorpha cephalotaxi]
MRKRSGAALIGPALVAAVAYVDPGNVATNVTAGATYGYLLVWVIVTANLMAGLVQYLSAKVGLVTGRSLPALVADELSRPARLAYWLQAELVAVATDLAEVVGGAIALALLFDLPLLLGGLVTGTVSMAVLAVHDRLGRRPFERVIVSFLLIVTVGFLAGLVVAPPAPGDVAAGMVPGFAGLDSVLLATAMLGATLMPHAVYLHSGLSADGPAARRLAAWTSAGRHPARLLAADPAAARVRRRAGRVVRRYLAVTRIDVLVAMVLAGTVNLGLLLAAATALRGVPGTDRLEGAYAAIADQLGGGIAVVFAVGLLASGLASTSVGCYAGAMIMEGLLRRRIPLLVRRLVTLAPALLLLGAGVDPTRALVLSQVVLSFGVPFAVVPLVLLTARRRLMGEATNHPATTAAAGVVAAVVTALNLGLVVLTFTGTG